MRPEATRVPSRIYVLFFFAAFVLFVSLSVSIITWGLPTEARKELYFTSRESLDKALSLTAPFVAGGKWQRSHLSPEDRDVVRVRPFFNLIRTYNPDEHDVLKPLAGMRPGDLSFNPHRFVYPAFLTYQAGALIFTLGKLKVIEVVKDVTYYLVNPGQFARFYIAGRALSLVYGIGVFLLTFLLGKRLFGPREGVWASMIVASSTLFVTYCALLKIDMGGIFWTHMALYFAMVYVQEFGHKAGPLYLAGLFAGLAAGTKYNLGLCLVSVVVAALVADVPKGRFARIFLTVFLAALAFFAVNPYIILSFNEFLADFTYAAQVVQTGSLSAKVLASVDYITQVLPRAGSPFFAVLITLGLVYGIARLKRHEAPLTVHLVLSLIILLKVRFKFASYTLTIIPVAAVYGAGLLESAFRRRASLAWAVVLLTFVANLGFTGAAIKLMKRDTRLEAGRWILKNIPQGTEVGIAGDQLAFSCPPLDENRFPVVDILKKRAPKYVVLSEHFYRGRAKFEKRDEIGRVLDSETYEKVKVFGNELYVLGINLGFTRKSPLDLVQLAPEIVVFKRVR